MPGVIHKYPSQIQPGDRLPTKSKQGFVTVTRMEPPDHRGNFWTLYHENTEIGKGGIRCNPHARIPVLQDE